MALSDHRGSVYHFKQNPFVGTRILPLNRLLETDAAVARAHFEKYANRPKLIQQVIEPLGCLWNDVIHLSPINPQLILDEWRRLGLPVPSRALEVFRIPSSILNESRTVICHLSTGNPRKDYFPFKADEYQESHSVSPEQIAEWMDQNAKGMAAFWYSATPHILTMDPIDVTGLEVFEIS